METREHHHRADRLVSQEVHACLSSLVATLAQGSHLIERGAKSSPAWDGASLGALADQAVELAAPVLDYESAAREAGWLPSEHAGCFIRPDDGDTLCRDWAEACQIDDIEPHELEVYEHWAVSAWLAEKLDAKGERVDTDFAGLNVWARTTTGQAIAADAVILAIAACLSEEA